MKFASAISDYFSNNMFPSTYRARLVLYTLILVVFLICASILSFQYTRDIMFKEVEQNLVNTIQLFKRQIEHERDELSRYVGIVSDDLRIKEYMFVVVRIGSDARPLEQLYEKLYGWLPIDRHVIMSEEGKTLVGEQNKELAAWLKDSKGAQSIQVQYRQRQNSLELVASAPIDYRNDRLGTVSITSQMDRAWLQHHRKNSGGQLFLEHDGQILISTYVSMEQKKLNMEDNKVKIGDEVYKAIPVLLDEFGAGLPKLWFAVSETNLEKKLDNYSRFIIILISLSTLVIVIMSLMIFRNFNRPIKALMDLTQEITEGKLPIISKSNPQNEIDVLGNKFVDMLHALREKQLQIDKVQRKLEQTAITDSLTGLYNRRHLQEIFPKLYSQAQRDWRYLSVILYDLDHFKSINDNYSHLAGDKCLVHFAKILQEFSRANDFLFRIGGEEFLVISIGLDKPGIYKVAEKIRLSTQESIIEFKDRKIPLTVSCGISFANPDKSTDVALPHLLSKADNALYEAKNNGRNQVRTSDLVLQEEFDESQKVS